MKSYNTTSGFCSNVVKASLAALFSTALLLSQPLHGASDTWVGNTDNTWGTSGNWTYSTGTGPVAAGDTLSFGAAGSSGTSLNDNLTAGINIAGITFNAGASAYTITGNSFTLGGNIANNGANLETINDNIALSATRTVTMTSGGGNLTLGGIISGTAFGLTTANSNTSTSNPVTLTLNGANTFTGALTVGSNTIVSLGSNTAAGTGAINISGDGGSHLNLQDGLTNVSGSALTLSNALNLGATGTSKDYITQVIAGSSALTFSGTVTNASGSTTANRPGFLSITNSAGVTFGTLNLALSTGTATADGLTIYGTGNLAITGAVADGTSGATSQNLTWDNTGTLTLNGALNNTGGLGVVAGTVALSSTATTSGSTTLYFGNGSANVSTSGINTTNVLTIGAATSGILTITGAAGTTTTDSFSNYTSSASNNGPGSTVFNQGAGHLNLTAGTGGSLVVNLGYLSRFGTGGTPLVNGASSLDIAAGSNVTVTTTTTNSAAGILSGALTYNGTTWATSAVTALTGISSNATGNVLQGTGLSLTAGQQISFSTIPTGSGLTANRIYYVINPTGTTFQIAATPGGTALTLVTSTGNGTADPAGAVTGYAAYNTSITTSSGNNNLDVQGSGTLGYNPNTIRFNQAASDTVTLQGGTSVTPIAGEGILETSTVAGNTSTITGGILTGGGAASNTGLAQKRDLVLIQNNTSGNLVINSIIATSGVATPTTANAQNNAGDLVKSGAGTVVLNGNNAYNGQTYVNEGTLVATGAYTAAQTQTTDTTTNGSNTVTVSSSTGLFVGENVTGTNVTPGTNTVPMVITSISGNTITLSNNAIVTSVGGATLNFMGSGALGNGGSYSGGFVNSVAGVAYGATLQIGNSTATGALAPNQSIIDNGTFSFGGASGLNLGANNIISGSGVVSQFGTGSTVLSALNTYTGNTTVTGGTLLAENVAGSTTASSTGIGTVTVSGTSGTSYGTLGGGVGATTATVGTLNSLTAGATSKNYGTGGASITGNVAVNNFGHLAPGGGTPGAGQVGTLQIGALTLATGSSLDYNFNSTSNSLLYATGAVTIGTGVNLNLYQEGTSNAFYAPGTYNLLAYGSVTGSSNLSVANQQADFTYTITNNVPNNVVQLGITENAAYWSGATNGSWGTNSNFNTSAAGGVQGFSPGSTTDVFFSTSSPTAANLTTTLDSVTAINSLNFNASSGNVTIGAGSGTSLTIAAAGTSTNSAGNGISLASGSGSVTINAPVVLGAAQTWTQGSSNSLTVNGQVSGAHALTTAGSGVINLAHATGNTYSGGTAVGGTSKLYVSNTGGSATGTGSLTVSNGATVGGAGIINASSYTINGNVQVGNGTDNTSGTTITGTTASTFGSTSSLTYNLDAGGTQTNLLTTGSTAVTFSALNLTFNLTIPGVLQTNTPLVLIAGGAGSGVNGSNFTFGGSLTTGTNALSQTEIYGAQLTFAGDPANWYANSYLILSNNDIELEVVPEPSTWAMMLGGLALLVVITRRKCKLS